MRMHAPERPAAGKATQIGAAHGSLHEVLGAPPRPHTTEPSNAGPDGASPIVEDTLRTPGQPMDAATRTWFERRFGHDFGNVCVHQDSRAIASARAINARAYTVGHDIVFGDGQYAPHTPSGRHLLAHELAHVIQQRPTGERGAGTGASGDPSTNIVHSPGPAVQRQPAGLPDKPPTGASGDEVLLALTSFFEKVQAAQGSQTLRVTPVVRQVLQSLVVGNGGAALRIDSYLSQRVFPGTPAGLARDAMRHLPLVIARERLARLDTMTPVETPDTRPASIGEAAASVFRKTITPIVNALPISRELKSTITEAALSAVGDGIVGIVDAAMANAPIDDNTKKAIHGAVDQLIKRKPSAPPASSPSADSGAREMQPSVAPSLPAVPGESITKGPSINTPGMGAPKPQAPQAPSPATGESLERTIQSVDKSALVPVESRGKQEAANFVDNAQDFARDVAKQLEAAQKTRRFSVDLSISAAYRNAKDVQAVFDEAEHIVRSVVDALPHHASQVGQVVVQIAGPSTSVRRIIRIHESR